MRVLLLAAGRGERMRPLTDSVPKPLLEAGGRALVEHHLFRLAQAGFTEVVVNLSWQGDAIRARLGDGTRYGLSIVYSEEGGTPLESAGGIVHALESLGDAPFAVVNADIFTDYPFERLRPPGPGRLAHLVLVPNPAHNPGGDFEHDGEQLTFAGIGTYAPELFAGLEPGVRPLAPLLRDAIAQGRVSTERWDGDWDDIGTPGRLASLRARL